MNKFTKSLHYSFIGDFYRATISFLKYLRYRRHPERRESLPPLPCQFCGQVDHTEKKCPNLKEMFLSLNP